MQVRPILLAVISCLFLSCASATDIFGRANTMVFGQITGQVRFADTKLPAYNVLVSCENVTGGGLQGQVLTDRQGRFSFFNIPLSQFTVYVRVAGYVEESQ